MDNTVVYSLIAIVALIFVIIVTLRGSSTKKVVNTKEEKRIEIIATYKLELQKALEPLENNKEAQITKKSSMLKKFSDELSRNIFFDKNEIKEIILELVK